MSLLTYSFLFCLVHFPPFFSFPFTLFFFLLYFHNFLSLVISIFIHIFIFLYFSSILYLDLLYYYFLSFHFLFRPLPPLSFTVCYTFFAFSCIPLLLLLLPFPVFPRSLMLSSSLYIYLYFSALPSFILLLYNLPQIISFSS